ncbi:hypothetical protein A3B35_03690 [Candidatus Kaiserbacteria bacterium RIFCSPLOWO2_01_FULL_54_24]|uniref:Glycosyltransferase subfamily 4-like N-terminal domain-containing protein n=1 Tax=Candidatus Kaiserbacteria bacterium RIFCSPLOWO2_01_FULL_54_24 TaxID=1798515 RepID=A0A1F6EVR1_9BACT|nr:MAG: hypothetical protein A3B35_03690 [Candidatus Kaiserbacteria bacterium RIFCSPLOWO2_01_FULL_54_24]
MKKILYVITKSNWGGAQRYVFDLATALPKDRFDVCVALGGNGLLAEKLGAAGIHTVSIPSFQRDISVFKEFKVLGELVRIFKQERPDVVHLNSSKAGGIGALAARLVGIKTIIFTSHGLAWDEDRNTLSRAAIWLASQLTFLLCHKVIVISRDNLTRVGTGKAVLIHNGLGPLQFMPREDARDALGLSPEAVVIGALGELTWNKNYHTLIHAAAELKRAGRDFVLCIIGGGEEQRFLEALIQESGLGGHMRMSGFLPDGYKYLKAFDIFVLPSVKEGLPYVLLEAAAAGLPAVGSNIPGIVDVLGEGAGLLVRPKDEKVLRDALASLLDDATLRQKLAAALQKKVEQEFSLQKMVAETATLY